MKKIQHFINGKYVSTNCMESTLVFNPATGENISEVVTGNENCIKDAVESAKAVFPKWSSETPLSRSRKMFKLKEIIESKKDELAKLITLEHGKTFEDALGEVGRGLEVIEFACGIPSHLAGNFTSDVGTSVDSWSDYQPIGICAGITPFNFPVMVPLWMFPIAIACGNCFILKPSERDPSSTGLLVEMVHDAGIPPGVLNLVNGGKETVDAILRNKDIGSVSFVGSTPIAHYVYQESAKYGKKVQAMGGAKNHMVVMPDADMDLVTDSIMGSVFGSAGERCMAISVVVPVGKETGDTIREKVIPKIENLKIGPGNDPSSEMGPLVTKQHLNKVKKYIDAGVKEGAELVIDGRNFNLQGYENGYFLGGSFFDNVTTDMSIYKEEIFGPVMSMVRSKSLTEALEMINKHEFGNGTAIFTSDGGVARKFSNECQIGMVGVNVPIPVPVAYHSFGGWKRSVFGGHGVYGMEAVRFYTRLKTVTGRWPIGKSLGAQYTFPSNN